MFEEEITVRDAMDLSGYTRVHIYTLIISKKIKARKVACIGPPGTCHVITRQSLVDYLKSRGRQVQLRGDECQPIQHRLA